MGLSKVLVFSAVLASVWILPLRVTSYVENCDDNLVQLKRALSGSKRILKNKVSYYVKKSKPLYKAVQEISQLYEQQSLLNEMIDNENSTAELTTITMLLDMAINRSCLWIQEILSNDSESFSCSPLEMKQLYFKMTIQETMERLYNALLDYKNCNSVNYCEWVKDNIICDRTTPEEVIKYITDYPPSPCYISTDCIK